MLTEYQPILTQIQHTDLLGTSIIVIAVSTTVISADLVRTAAFSLEIVSALSVVRLVVVSGVTRLLEGLSAKGKDGT